MKPSSLVVLAVLVCAAATAGQPPATIATDGPPAHQIVVSYFHGDARCATCKKLESWTRAAVEQAFADELTGGRLAFRTVNTDREENRHFLTDYSLVTKAVVVTEEADGKVLRWTNLDQIWQLVRGQQPTFADYIVRGVRSFLEPAS